MVQSHPILSIARNWQRKPPKIFLRPQSLAGIHYVKHLSIDNRQMVQIHPILSSERKGQRKTEILFSRTLPGTLLYSVLQGIGREKPQKISSRPLSWTSIHYIKHISIDIKIDGSNPPQTQQRKVIGREKPQKISSGPLSWADIHYIKHVSIDNKIDGSNPPYTQQRMEMAEKKRKKSFRGQL